MGPGLDELLDGWTGWRLLRGWKLTSPTMPCPLYLLLLVYILLLTEKLENIGKVLSPVLANEKIVACGSLCIQSEEAQTTPGAVIVLRSGVVCWGLQLVNCNGLQVDMQLNSRLPSWCRCQILLDSRVFGGRKSPHALWKGQATDVKIQ